MQTAEILEKIRQLDRLILLLQRKLRLLERKGDRESFICVRRELDSAIFDLLYARNVELFLFAF